MQRILPGRMEFHVSRLSRDRYQFDEVLFSLSGNVIFANFHAARRFAQRMNERRDLINYPERVVRAGQINAMGLIDEILHRVVDQYRLERNSHVWEEALVWLKARLGDEALENILRQFTVEFPSLTVYRREISLEDYLNGQSVMADGRVIPNRQIVIEELLMLWLANANPAFEPFFELFNDENLVNNTAYSQLVALLPEFFETQPFYGPENQNLIEMLRSPAISSPNSLTGQLEFIRTKWGSWGAFGSWFSRFYYLLLSSLDLIKEEEKRIFLGPGPSFVYEFRGLEAEPEKFSRDMDWMPRLMLIAKNAYVWLDQLSKRYRRSINHLDDIPEEELEKLARWGFTGLWLIGVWERSLASKTIKQLRGNRDAVASAYSLFNYDIASDLGGDQAYQVLHDRAWKYGIRLASDMVPNHMGVDSRWVIEHPDWFISLDQSPFPSYSFNGPNLSWDNRVGIYIDDHYFDNSDAAVVFKRVDFYTGDVKYIYHGNDGTSFPWNDTAQLNYLLPQVREAVIQTILHVARKFPVIRFDAAMTLAKRHFHRLWFPEPGSGGDIPSRAGLGLTKEQFDVAFPEEFWRMVVDRVALEVPDTLLLAEAFWLMEGYFVRTLGMHRVYNSAFMNMLRDEKNQQYRQVIKNTVEFDPEILKRYVNFINNPDERTAVDQFGKSDKYFGVCTLMVTMPGLPMFGHGQVEGFTEKYGMEFRRAMYDEQPDGYLVERHEREIFPLLRRRYLFAEVKNFRLYDFYTPEGVVNENVFVFSNRFHQEKALVIYNNNYFQTSGWVRTSTPFPVKGKGDEKSLEQIILGEGLGVSSDPEAYVIFRDHVTGLEYLHNCQEFHQKGLYAQLNGYQYHVFLDFRQVVDNQWHHYSQLAAYLNGRGVPSMDEAMKEILLQPLHAACRELFNAGFLRYVIDNRSKIEVTKLKVAKKADLQKRVQLVLVEAENKMVNLLREVKAVAGGEGDEVEIARQVRGDLASAIALPALEAIFPSPQSKQYKEAIAYLLGGKRGLSLSDSSTQAWSALLSWLFLRRLGQILDSVDFAEISRTWIDEWMLGRNILLALKGLDLEDAVAERTLGVIKLLLASEGWCQTDLAIEECANQLLNRWLKNGEIQQFLGINRFQGVLWFNAENYEEWLWWVYAREVVLLITDKQPGDKHIPAIVTRLYKVVQRLSKAEAKSGYQVEKLLKAVNRRTRSTKVVTQTN